MDYYIRSWDPDSTYPANPQEGDVCYTITLDQSWAPVAGVKNDNLLKEEVYQSGAWVEVGGGGGSSLTVIYDGDIIAEEHGGQYGGQVTPDTPFPYDHDAPREGCPETITVVFNGTTYSDVPWAEDPMGYGSVDFSDYPFVIGFYSQSEEVYDNLWMVTASAGTFSVKVSADVSGGGNESPFTTCTVTVTISKAGFFGIPNVTPYDNISCGIYTSGNISGLDCSVIIPKNADNETIAKFVPESGTYNAACTGDITFSSHDSEFSIKGDGTITITPGE